MSDAPLTEAPGGPYHFDFDQIGWSGSEAAKATPAAMVEQAKRLGAKRKRIVKGEGGFHMNYSSLPADYHIARHRHGHPELIMVVDGGATVHGNEDGSEDIVMEEGDSIVIEAGFYYSITVGSEGMNFVTIRTSASETKLE
ncbi:MAG: cupin domain-containing protein [Microthrixaceae bacterium]|nr:cupin domain-containing protein [Microthrixaceae bacterium]